MITFFTIVGFVPNLAATCACARFWSSCVNEVNCDGGMDGANRDAINAFVFAGFPTTKTLTDFFATCAEVVGVPLGDGRAEDSFSFASLLRGEKPLPRAPVIHHSAAGMFAIRSGRWKLVAGNGSGGRQQPRGKPFGEPFQLFDLNADLEESKNVAADFPEVVADLTAQLQRLRDAGGSR